MKNEIRSTNELKSSEGFEIYNDENSQNAKNNNNHDKDSDLEESILDDADHKKFYEENGTNVNKLSFTTRYFSPIKEGSLRGSIVSIASITFGGGCLSFPYAIAQTGPLLGFIIYSLIGIFSYWTIYILYINGYEAKILDYNKLTEEYLGVWNRRIADFSNLLLCFGLLISYQYIISSLCLQSLNYFFNTECEGVTKIIQILICMALIQIPLSTMKNVSSLQYISISGTLALILATLIIMFEFPFYLSEYIQQGNVFTLFPPNKNLAVSWIDTTGIFLFGFSSHNGIFQIFAEMNKPNKRRCVKVLKRAFYLEIILYFCLSFSGFFSTFYDTPDVFLKRKNLIGFPNDYVIIITKIILVITLNSCMAMNYNIMRMSYNSLILNEENPPFWKDFSMILLIYISSNSITYFLTNAGTLISMLGGLCTTFVCFIVPLLLDIKVSPEKKTKTQKIISLLGLIVITILGTVCFVKSIYDFINSSGGAKIC